LQDPACTITISAVVKLYYLPVPIEKLDDRSVRLSLPRPSDSFISSFGRLRIAPAHLYEGVPPADMDGAPANNMGIGSGPYQIERWQQGEGLTLTRFEDYYGPAETFGKIEFRIIPDAAAQEIAFRNNETNFFRIMTEDALNNYQADPGRFIYSLPEGRINYLTLNANSPLTADIAVREAIVKALDIPEIVAGAYGSELIAVPANSLYHPEDLYYDPTYQNYQQDLARAGALIDETGLAGKTARLVYNSARLGMEETATMIHQQLKAVDINVELMPLDSAGFFAALFASDAGDWDLGLNGFNSNGNARYASWLIPGSPIGVNTYVSDEVGELWLAVDLEPERERRQALYNDLLSAIMDCYTIVPISSPNAVMVSQIDSPAMAAFLARYYVKVY
jgi:peptide/nickel transport system substrate-binding protein